MKEKMTYYDSLALYIVAMIALWIPGIFIIIGLILSKKFEDIFYWIFLIIISILVPTLTIVLSFRCMQKIILDEQGVKKSFLRYFKKQEFSWNNIKDYKVITRPNGYAYLVISNKKIMHDSFIKCLKDVNHCICFTYNEKAFNYIKNKITN